MFDNKEQNMRQESRFEICGLHCQQYPSVCLILDHLAGASNPFPDAEIDNDPRKQET